MRLESMKLAGFKSFVDPTTVAFPSNLTAIVGPNGCGKSNIIDSIRWVMGESSAKQLRGQSLEDVIFNGCRTRKPLGKASIELNFDNSAGKLGGQYNTYTQISIRREITRDGQSIYFLNGSRCRRRDIRDIFLGTGLGPRSYAIIEQGMISRIIEAKPDELRAYIEETAGISKYKERRHETTLRLEHTQENLSRLNDLQQELLKQSQHLQQQADTAERYKTLKQEERLFKAQLQTLHYQALHNQLQHHLSKIKKVEEALSESQLTQKTWLRQIAKDRQQQAEIREEYDALQTQYYKLDNEIIRLEENLQTQIAQIKKNRCEETDLTEKKIILDQQIEESRSTENQLNQAIAQLEKEEGNIKKIIEEKRSTLQQAELALQNWQISWEETQDIFIQSSQQHHRAQTQNQHHDQQCQKLKQRLVDLQQTQEEQNHILIQTSHITDLGQTLTLTQQAKESCQSEQQQIMQQVHEQRSALQQLSKKLDDHRNHLQILQGKYTALITLQEEALGKHEQELLQWLEKHQLMDQPRLVQLLKVETDWEYAVEVALTQHIQAICYIDSYSLEDFLAHPPPRTLSIMAKPTWNHETPENREKPLPLPRLSTKLTAPWPLHHLLTGIYAAETSAEAILYVKQLQVQESIITRQGLHFGSHWLRLTTENKTNTGLLQREHEITRLNKTQQEIQKQLIQEETIYSQIQQQLKNLEEKQLDKQKQLAELISCQADLNTRQQVQQSRLTQAKQNMQRIQQELKETQQQYDTAQEDLRQTQQTQQTTQTQLEQIEKKREALLENKNRLQSQYKKAIQEAKQCEEQSHQLELQRQTLGHQSKAFHTNLVYLQQKQETIDQRFIVLQQSLENTEKPLILMKETLEKHLEKRKQLIIQREKKQTNLQTIEQQIKQTEQALETLESHLALERDSVEQQRFKSQEIRIRAKTLEEQLQEQGYQPDVLLTTRPVDKDSCETRLKEIKETIEQIGAVNLTALEEHKAIYERKKYLDIQHKDLFDALQTLETAIQKIDKETRNRFKETFEKVNQNFMALFPHLFSGGDASLRLQNPDLLSSGIYIMAQPPGKQNSTIHLLSGGEKALTAIALIFSFFQLNPAPFCMLDEVDAPLDEVNILRFCRLVKELSQEVQFVFISHNKVTIEMAQHLAGITMNEPGVSRMVTVDVANAIAIAEA